MLLSSIVTSRHATAPCTSPLTFARGSASPPRWGSARSRRRSPPARRAAGDVELDFKHTGYAFLQSAPFLLALVVGVFLLTIVERRLHTGADPKQGGGLERGPLAVLVVVVSVLVGALLFAGELSRAHAAIWPGYLAGGVCAVIGAAASRPLFARARARLDDSEIFL